MDDMSRSMSGVEPISVGGDVEDGNEALAVEAASRADWLSRHASCSLSMDRRFIARDSASKRRSRVLCFSANSLSTNARHPDNMFVTYYCVDHGDELGILSDEEYEAVAYNKAGNCETNEMQMLRPTSTYGVCC
jgi:hypothetical protein